MNDLPSDSTPRRGRPPTGAALSATERQRQRRARQEGAGQVLLREWVPADRAEEARHLLALLRQGAAIAQPEELATLAREVAAERDRAEAAEARARAAEDRAAAYEAAAQALAAPAAGAASVRTELERRGGLLGRLLGRGGQA